MIAVDASVAIPWFEGGDYPEVRRMDELMRARQIVFPAVVVTEVLSGPAVGEWVANVLSRSSVLPILEGYWIRAGQLRSRVRAAGRKARLADSLVAQACVDSDLALLARDSDFQAFAELGGLRLA